MHVGLLFCLVTFPSVAERFNTRLTRPNLRRELEGRGTQKGSLSSNPESELQRWSDRADFDEDTEGFQLFWQSPKKNSPMQTTTANLNQETRSVASLGSGESGNEFSNNVKSKDSQQQILVLDRKSVV